jgi:hypothetical protein
VQSCLFIHGETLRIGYCRTEDNVPCEGAELQHIETRMVPNPNRPKDAVTHSLYWRRMGTLAISCLGLFRAKVPNRLQALNVMATPSLSQSPY